MRVFVCVVLGMRSGIRRAFLLNRALAGSCIRDGKGEALTSSASCSARARIAPGESGRLSPWSGDSAEKGRASMVALESWTLTMEQSASITSPKSGT